MGRVVAELADRAWITSDNPRSEDPATIRAAVLEGCPDATEVPDRAEAILRGVDALIWTILLSRAFGPGPLTGTLASGGGRVVVAGIAPQQRRDYTVSSLTASESLRIRVRSLLCSARPE